MAKYLTQERKPAGATPVGLVQDEALGGRPRIYRATIALDAPVLTPTTNGTQITLADTVELCKVPGSMRFVRGFITSSVSLGTSTISIGTAADPVKYLGAVTLTAVNTPTAFGKALAMGAAAPNATEETIILTPGVASLPNTAGARLIVDLEFAGF